MGRHQRLSLSLFFCLWIGCVRAPKPVPPPSQVVPSAAHPPSAFPLVKLSADKFPSLEDDFELSSLRTAALQSAVYYRSRPATDSYNLAGDTYTAADFADSLSFFVQLIDASSSTPGGLTTAVRQNFEVYQSVGVDSPTVRTVTFSSYYEPTIPARLTRTDVYRYPIYGRPADLIDVDLGQFNTSYQGARISGRREGPRLVPYYSRTDIDTRKRLGKKARPVAWARTPTDIFFLQIEGSGWLNLGKGKKVRIRYDGDNGRRYRSAGQYLVSSGRVSGSLSHERFETYLNTHPKERQSILNVNDRYVFFRIDKSTAGGFAYGNIDRPLTAGRSIATDPKLFPKGLLAWIDTDRPVLDDQGDDTGKSVALTRFMLNQDEGGAIQGPARVDFFAGDGIAAHHFATHFWQKGKLYFLVKKRSTATP